MSDHKHVAYIESSKKKKKAQNPLFFSFFVTFILTLSCPLLFYYQARLHTAESVGELVHGADHHFCGVNQLLCSAAGETGVLVLYLNLLVTIEMLQDSIFLNSIAK